MAREKNSHSPWTYNITAVSSLENPDELRVIIDLHTYIFMANELSDRIQTNFPYIREILYTPNGGYLAAIVGKNLSIGTSQMIDIENETLERLNLIPSEDIILLSNENIDRKIVDSAKKIKVGVLFENPDIKDKADISIIQTQYKVIFPQIPLELEGDMFNYPAILQEASDQISRLILSGRKERSLDLSQALSKLKNQGFDIDLLPSLSDFYFSGLLLGALRKRFKDLYNKDLKNTKLLRLLLPGINEDVLNESKITHFHF